MARKPQHLSSRELLERIGLSEDNPIPLLEDEPLDGMRGDIAAALRTRYRLFSQTHRFAPGDLVTWKPGLKNRRIPRYGQPAVVVALLEPPGLDQEEESGSTYFREPLDLVLGVVWDRDPGRGEFVTFHFDSRRFQPWRENA